MLGALWAVQRSLKRRRGGRRGQARPGANLCNASPIGASAGDPSTITVAPQVRPVMASMGGEGHGHGRETPSFVTACSCQYGVKPI